MHPFPPSASPHMPTLGNSPCVVPKSLNGPQVPAPRMSSQPPFAVERAKEVCSGKLSKNTPSKFGEFTRVFSASLFSVVFFLSVVCVLVFESKLESLDWLRENPELQYFKNVRYDPTKEFILRLIGLYQ